MAERGSIVMDIRAQVSGYEQSLRKLQAEFAKVDPGSQIGKSLTKAIQDAENQLKGLNKNLTPRVSSDTQIDNTIQKVNNLGEAVQRISGLMRQVTTSDINFDAADSSIAGLVQQLQQLQAQLEETVTISFRDTISNTDSLNDAFKKLKIDITGKTRAEIFDELTKKSGEAAKAVLQAQKAADQAKTALTNSQNNLALAENNPLLNKDVLIANFNQVGEEYKNLIANLQNELREGLKSLSDISDADREKIIAAFTGGLTQDNLKEHLEQLRESVQQQLKTTMNSTDLFKMILPTSGQQGRIPSIVKSFKDSGLLPTQEELEQLRDALIIRLQSISRDLSPTGTGTLINLASTFNFNGFIKELEDQVDKAQPKLVGKITQLKQAVDEALKASTGADQNLNAATADVTNIQNLINELYQIIQTLMAANNELSQKIAAVEGEIGNKQSAAAENLHQIAEQTASTAREFDFARDAAQKYKDQLERVKQGEQLIGKVQGVIQRWFSIYAVVRMVSQAINQMKSTLQELDKTITEIAIVTKMDQSQLWGQMGQYTEIAREYAASISGVYKVSQLYYQQGLEQADVMALTTETLKMARISGLDYAEATDYMTNAVRSFKMEMTDAQRVVDVYSAIAASSATNVTELAKAMSKTASSAEAVGSSFENTTAMMAVMIEATRESAENIGSAMKSIISRYGEMKADPSKLVDSEGEAMSLNKVDKALQTVGISIQDINHQFRDFDDVIMELAEKWNTIDKNTQRYIATIMAGNRQQSRFLALVSSYDRLKELSAEAASAEDAAQLQYLKTLDSVDAKIQQLQTSIQSLYVDSGLETIYKWLIDSTRAIVDNLTSLNTWFKLPIPAIAAIGIAFWNLTNVVHVAFTVLKAKLALRAKEIREAAELEATQGVNERVILTQVETEKLEAELERRKVLFRNAENEMTAIHSDGINTRNNMNRMSLGDKLNQTKLGQSILNTKAGQWLNNNKIGVSIGTSLGSMAVSILASSIKNEQASGWLNTTSSALSGVSMGAAFGPVGMLIGGLSGTLLGFITNWDNIVQSDEKKLQQLQEEAEEAKNTYIQKKSDTQNLATQIEQLRKLEKTMYDSKEAQDEYYQAANQFSDTYPELIKSLNSAGDAVIDLDNAELKLIDIRKEGIEAAIEATNKEYKLQKEREKQAQQEVLSSIRFKTSEEVAFSDLTPSNHKSLYEQFMTDDEIDRLLEINNLDFDFDEFDREVQFLLSAEFKDDQLFEAQLRNLEHNYGQFYGPGLSERISELREPVQQKFNSTQDDINKYNKEFENLFRNVDNLSYDEIIAKSNALLDEINEFAPHLYSFYFNQLEEQIPDFSKAFEEYFQEKSLTSMTISSGITKEINSHLLGMQDDYLQEIPDVIGFMTQSAVLEFNKQKDQDFSVFNSEVLPGLITTYTNFWEEFWKSFDTQDAGNEFINLLKNNKKMSRSKMEEQLSSEEFSELTEDARNSILSYYYDDTYNFDKFKDRYNNINIPVITTLGEEINKDNDNILQELGSNELQVINAFNDELISFIKNNNYVEEDADLAMQDYLNIIRELRDDEVAQTIFFGWDRTLNGLQDVKQQLEELGYTNLNFNNLMQLPININTELNSYVDSLVSQLEDFEKALSKVSKGMDIKDAMEIANKLNISISEFNFKGGKFFLKETENIQGAYINYSDELFDRVLKEANNRIEELEKQAELTNDESKELENLKKQVADIKVLKDNYAKYQTNALRIQNGQIIEVLAEIAGNDQANTLYTQALQGDFTGFTGDLAQYVSIITDTLKDATDVVINAAVNSIKTGKGVYVKASEINQNLIQSLSRVGLAEYNSELEQYLLTVTKDNFDAYVKAINDTKGLTDLQKADYIKQGWDAAYSDNLVDIFTSFTSSATVSREVADKFILAIGGTIGQTQSLLESWGYVLNTTTGEFEFIGESLEDLRNQLGKVTDIKQRNKIEQQIAELEHQPAKDKFSSIKDIFSNYESVTEDQIRAYADARKVDFEKIEASFEYDKDTSTYKISLEKLQNLIKDSSGKAREVLEELYAGIADDYLDALFTAVSYATQGTTKQADMRKFVNDYKEVVRKEISLDKAFNWNDTLQAFILDSEVLNEYIEKQKQNIKDKFGTDAAEKWLTGQIKQYQNAIDVSGYLSSDRTAQDREQLKEQIKAAFILQNKEYDDTLIDGIEKGGLDAVEALREVKPEASSEEIQNVYRAVVDDQLNALEAIGSLTAGQIIATNGALYEALSKLGMVDSNGVIKETFNMVAAYTKIYENMKDTAGKTQSDLNKAYADVLTAGEQQEIDAIETMSNAMGMTYYQLGEILGKYGKDLEEFINNQTDNSIIEKIGNGKIRINDFNAFAQEMGWKYGSEEYLSAFKAYNDSLVELNRQTEKSILEEVKNVIATNRGNKVNLTYLIDTLGAGAEQILNEQLKEYGASIKDGILTISESADLIGISQTIQNAAENSGKLMEEELAEITDSITEAINNYSELLIKGITGNLTNVDLQKLMKDSGLQSVTYEKTADGLRLTQEYLIRLYSAMDAGVNKIKVFDELNKYLQENNEHYKTAGANLVRISELNKLRVEEAKKLLDTSGAISEADKQISQNRLKQYSQELAVAEKIAAVRATTEDSSYSFMDQEMPGGFQNPINYWESWGKAMKSIQEAGENGYIGIQDYYNMITHIQDLAVQTGKDMKFMGMTISQDGTSAAELIERGFKAMTLDVESGNTVLSLDKLSAELGEIGFDFKAGAEGFDENIQDGIHEFAQSQVDMLDSMIKFVETIVAMEKLGDLDIKGDGIDFSDIFSKSFYDPSKGVTWNYTKQYQEVAQTLLESGKDLEGITVAGYTLKQILEDAKNGIKNIAIENDDLVALLQALYSTSISQNYNLSDIYNSILETFQTNGISGELSLGQSKIYIDAPSGITLEFNDEISHWYYNGEDLGDDPQDALKQALEMRAKDLENLDVEVPEAIKAGDKTVEQNVTNVFQLTIQKLELDAEDADVEFQKDKEPKKSVTLSNNINAIAPGANVDLSNEAQKQAQTTATENLKTALQGLNPLQGERVEGKYDAAKVGLNKGATVVDNTIPDINLQLFREKHGNGEYKLEKDANGKWQKVKVSTDKVVDETPAIIDNKTNNGQYPLADAIANFASLIIGIASATSNGNGTTSGGVNAEKVKEALDNYKDSLRTANENKALETLFAALNIDVNNSEGTPTHGGKLAQFLANPEIDPKVKQLICEFASILVELLHGTDGNTDVEGVEDIEQFITTFLSDYLTGEQINALIGIIHASLEPGAPVDGMQAITSGVSNKLAEEKVPGNVIQGVIEIIEAELGDNFQAKRLSNVKEAKLRAKLKKACDLTDEQINATISTINAILAGEGEEVETKDVGNKKQTLETLLKSDLKLSEETIEAIVKYIDASTTNARLSDESDNAENLRNKVIKLLGGENGAISIGTIDAIIAGYNLTVGDEPNINDKKYYDEKGIFKNILFEEDTGLWQDNKVAWNKYLNDTFSTGNIDSLSLVIAAIGELSGNGVNDNQLQLGNQQGAISLIQLTLLGVAKSNINFENDNTKALFFSKISSYLSALTGYQFTPENISALIDIANITYDLKNTLEQSDVFEDTKKQLITQLNDKISDLLNEQGTLTAQLNAIDLVFSTINQIIGIDGVSYDPITKKWSFDMGVGTVSGLKSAVEEDLTNIKITIGTIDDENVKKWAKNSIAVTITPNFSLGQLTNEERRKAEEEFNNNNDNLFNFINSLTSEDIFYKYLNDAITRVKEQNGILTPTEKNIFEAVRNIYSKDSSAYSTYNDTLKLSELNIKELEQQAEILGQIIGQLNELDDEQLKEVAEQIQAIIEKIGKIKSPEAINITAPTGNAIEDINKLQEAINNLSGATIAFKTEGEQIQITLTSMAKGNNRDFMRGNNGGGGGGVYSVLGIDTLLYNWAKAKGNLSLAKGTATLMGELGPELYVSGGRYFVAGQNGAEMVNLPDDAIVFNHLQTQQLLTHGSTGRGKPTTNEKNAVSFAKGGPAQASASSVLSTLKHLRAQWQAIANASLQDLASTAGSGGGGGGNDNLAIFIKDVERWYNWLQKIARLEEQITYQEQLRAEIESELAPNGKAYYTSQKASLKALKEQAATASSLASSQEDFYKKRMRDLENSPFARFYEFDEFGQIKYKSSGFTELSQLLSTNDQGLPNYTAEQQYNWLISQGYGDFMKYDSSGQEIKKEDDEQTFFENSVKAFFDRLDSEKEELQGLHDSIEEQKKAVLEKIEKINELIKEMRDNQKDVENSVLKAIEESREREIKKIEDTKDALQDSNEKLVEHLSNQLEKERKLYEKNQNDEELNRMRRQLSILQRSGGSAAEIASLQKQIEEASKDQYFEKQQEQIDAVKEASDLQIERMDHQIELMNEQLEYQKANGLLWTNVYEVMSKSPQEIADFIKENTSEFWSKSPIAFEDDVGELIFKTERWAELRDDVNGIYDILNMKWNIFAGEMEEEFGSGWNNVSDENKAIIKQIFDAKLAETGDYNAAAAAARQSSVYQDLKKQQKVVSTEPLNINTASQETQNNEHLYQANYTIQGYDDRGFPLTPITGSGVGETAEIAKSVAAWYANQHIQERGIKSFEPIDYQIQRIYKNGGLIDYTGPAWVDGTKQKPESIWDADTTKLLKDNLFNTSKLNLLSSFWDTLQGYETAANHSYSNNSESLIIENAVVNMNVASIANDYDARRAGEQAMEEMLRIARKTRVSNF